MPDNPDVSAIVDHLKARIKHIEDELARHDRLSDELKRLRDALARLEGPARRMSGRRDRRPAPTRGHARPASATKRANTSIRAPRGQNKAKVLDTLKNGPMTASEIAEATGIGTATVSTLLTKLTKTGEVAKAERGYRLPG